ncbi:MAG: coenzyme F420-reducing hydrogenase subunit beta [Syntrophus sp. PtaB.Bin001]|nr:MAG: coenzyme F420-reducing hydrogenase subunit beta [Syntrophus sp. PtaB.Bin001]
MNITADISCVVEKMLCCTCGACAAVCRQEAISYEETVGGHLFPVIDKERCTACGLCYKACPSVNVGTDLRNAIRTSAFEGTALECHVGKAADRKLYVNSQSGGIVSALLMHLLETHEIGAAVVCAMVPGNPPRPVVLCAESKEQILSAQKSKYCPIPVLGILRDVRKRNLPVALVGLPCHFHGLSSMADIDAALVQHVKYKIGLVCDRVMTYGAIDYLIRQAGFVAEEETLKFDFRDKAHPQYPGNVVIGHPGKEPKILPDGTRNRIKNAFTPARCRVCFDKMNILSDITVCDPHGLKDIDRRDGESAVIVRTEKGRTLIREAVSGKRLYLKKADYGEITRGQKIERKRREWRGYAEAWLSLGMDLPAVYPYLTGTTEHMPDDSYKTILMSSLAHDRHVSRKALLASVEDMVQTSMSEKKGHKPKFSHIRQILSRVTAALKTHSSSKVY